MSFDRSHAGYYADFWAAPLIAGAGVLVALARSGIDLVFLALVAEGLVAWTLVEYVMHRALFHRVPWIREEHARHHDHPAALIGASPLLTWPLMIAAVALGGGAGVGLVLGYLGYVWAHDAIHHAKIGPRHPLYGAKLRHAAHHAGLEANYGVATPIWDYALGTYAPAGRKR